MILKTERKRPKSWAEFRARSKSGWLLPFLALDWGGEWIAYWLSGWALLEVLEYLQTLSLLLVVVLYFADTGNRLKQKHYQAWQVINTAQGKGGNGGRIDALEELLEDGVSLIGVGLEDAYLAGVDLHGAELTRSSFHGADVRNSDFRRTNLTDADLQWANFRHSNFSHCQLQGANLTNADLNSANLAEADLSGTDCSKVDFRSANLLGVKWQQSTAIKLANVYGVVNPPPGFLDWAKSAGAVSIESDDEWRELLKKSDSTN
jgi:Pentapeptide repeats (8 copies)